MRTTTVTLALGLLAACANEGPRSTLTADQAAQMRQQCAFPAGTAAGLTLAKDAPIGHEIPIDTIVIVMMENRSFDHLLGALPQAGQPDAEVAPATASNNDSMGNPVPWFHQTDFCFSDTNHEWDGSHLQYNGGAMDGFVKTNEDRTTDGKRAMGYYDQNDLNWVYAAANAYAISDRHHCSVLGPTYVNRAYLYAGTSYGYTDNQLFTGKRMFINLFEDFNATKPSEKVSWKIYYEVTVPGSAIFVDVVSNYLDNTAYLDNFIADAAAGKLSNVNFLDANLGNENGSGDDFHPPGDMQNGQEFLAKVVDAVTKSPQWPHTALFITFDEHGGLYDHLPPPAACAPDDIAPVVPNGATAYDYARYGFRVPLFVVSPYAKPHYVSHVTTDHTSIMRFVEARFRLGAQTKRDANADPLFDMFDFTQPKLLTPPSLPAPITDAAKAADCAARYPKKTM